MDALLQTSTNSGAALNSPSVSLSSRSNTALTTSYTPSTCLFCPQVSTNLESSIHHMSKSHNFFIPDQEYLIDISSFLAFLNTVISEFHECLFCGTTRSSKFAAQDHMKSKGHCRIDLEDELEEWADFWDYPVTSNEGEDFQESEGHILVGALAEDDKLHLQTGKTLGHRSNARQFRQNPNRTPLSPPSPSHKLHIKSSNNPEDQTQPSTSTALAIRSGTSTSLVGVPEFQQRALRVAEKKTIQMETRAQGRFQGGVERRGNRKKFFVVLRRKERVPGSV